MPNQKPNCFFTPHPLTKHYSRQSKPYHRSNQSKQTKQSTQNINNNNSGNNKIQISARPSSVPPGHQSPPIKPSHPTKSTQKHTKSSSPSSQRNKKKKLDQTRNNLNFNDFSLAQPHRTHFLGLSDQIDDLPPTGVADHPSTQIDEPDNQSSSLSSLSSEDGAQISDQSQQSLQHHPIQSTPSSSHIQSVVVPDRLSPNALEKLSDKSSPHQISPSLPGNTDFDLDDGPPSQLGEDVCLEYTDFGQDLGFPVTWSESDYDEDDEGKDQSNEFAEFLLMDSGEADQLFGFNQLETIQSSSMYTQMISGIHTSEDEGSDSDSYLGYMFIEEFDPKQAKVEQADDRNPGIQSGNEEDLDHQQLSSQSFSGDDGATTDSLDEDDHSGLERFGIEADHSSDFNCDDDLEDAQDACFANLPASPAPGSMRHNLDLSVPATATNSSHLVDPRVKDLTIGQEIKFPIMGTFSVSRKDRIHAGRTIIDEKKSPPLSPFTGGKVIRYNRFKKLRQQSCTAESEQSSLACTPKPEESQGLPGPGRLSNLLVEDELDITAFIRGISSVDEGCSDGEQKNGFEVPTAELDGLSRWQRVPMSAFRRRMMMKSQEGKNENERLRLEGVIQTSSSLVETLSLCEQPAELRHKKKYPRSQFLSSLTNSNKAYDRHNHHRLRKTKSYNSNGKQSKLDHHKSSSKSSKRQQQPEPKDQSTHEAECLNGPNMAHSTNSWSPREAGIKREAQGEKAQEEDVLRIGLTHRQTTDGEGHESKIFNQFLGLPSLNNPEDNDKNESMNSTWSDGNIDSNHAHFNHFDIIHNQLNDLEYPSIF